MKRFDKGYIYVSLLSDLLTCLFLSFIIFNDFFVSEEGSLSDLLPVLPYFIAVFAVIYILFTVYRIFYYRTSGYELAEKEIKCNRGVVFKKRSVLEYKKIHAVNKKQNLIHRIFGIAVLTVDSGSANTAHQAEIMIIEKSAVVDALIDKLNSLKDGNSKAEEETEAEESKKTEVLLSDKDSLYRFTSGKKFLYSFINIVTTLFFGVISAILIFSVLGICNAILKLDLFGSFVNYLIFAIMISVGAMLLVSFFSFVGSIIHSFVGYYGFTVRSRDNNIEISYGILEKHTNTFSYDRIKAVKITQSLVQRMLGFAEIRIEVIGYTNPGSSEEKNSEIGVLVPFCKYSEIDEILKKVLPDYIPSKKQTSCAAFFPFVSWFLLLFCVISAAVTAVTLAIMAILKAPAVAIISVALVALGIVVLVAAIKFISAILSYKTNGIAIDGEKISAYSGGFSKCVTVFLAKNMIAVEKQATPLREKCGISSVVIHLKTNEQSNEVKVHIQKSAVADELEKMLLL